MANAEFRTENSEFRMKTTKPVQNVIPSGSEESGRRGGTNPVLLFDATTGLCATQPPDSSLPLGMTWPVHPRSTGACAVPRSE